MTPETSKGTYLAQEAETFHQLLTGIRMRFCGEHQDRPVLATVTWRNGEDAFCSEHALQLLDKLPALAATALGLHA